MRQILNEECHNNIYLRPYEIFVTGSTSGILEFVPDTVSIDYLKKKFPARDWTLATFYERYFKDDLMTARLNFVQSLAGYSLFSYLFNVKDRHNGNILIDSKGHLVHIDFGFFLQNSPGNVGFESAPFKFTQEYLDIMGGKDSDMFCLFKNLLMKGLTIFRKHLDELIYLIKIMASGWQSTSGSVT
jgi:phosphatidylinositol 4-kinase